ncbi:MAG: DedA family protein [Vicinamibacteria bacterium]|jgi:membrane protein DedA with SNARE-associated domain|nr:DedA family protein [Vicinamibacteria bacterium]
MLHDFLNWLIALPTPATYTVLVLMSALENIFPPVPADVAVALGAFLSQRGEVSAPLLGFVCWAGNMSSAAGMYCLGRLKGPHFFSHGWPSRILPPQALKMLHDIYEKYGVFGIFISRFMPGFRAAVTPFAGVVQLSPVKALVPAACASAIWYAMLVTIGSALGLEWETIRLIIDRLNSGLGLLALILAGLGAFWWMQRRRARARE